MSISALHSKQIASDGIHSPVSFVYLDQAQRLAATDFENSDGYKLAIQLSDNTLWLLTSISPEWASVKTSTNESISIVDEHWAGGLGNWTAFISGSAAVSAVSPTINGIYGVIRLDSGDGYTSSAELALGIVGIDGYEDGYFNLKLGTSGLLVWECYLKPGAVPSNNRDYSFFAGFGDSDGYNRIGFLVDRAESDGYWCALSKSQQAAIVDISDAAIRVGYWTLLRLEFTGSSATFFINDAEVSTISTNLPLVYTLYPSFKIQKDDGPLLVKYDLDWVRISESRNFQQAYDPVPDQMI